MNSLNTSAKIKTHVKTRAFVALALFALAASVTVGYGQAVVDWNDVHQRIDGFGGGVVFLNPASMDPVTIANADTLFGTTNANQLGLSLIRVGIDQNTNWNNALLDGQKAVARGARILASPWTPPLSMKTTNATSGGSLLTTQYANYANYLNNFALYMKNNGAPLAAISIQNEPDFLPTNPSCGWTSIQLQTFCHNNASAITAAPVLMPESASYDQTLSDATLNDPVAASNVTFVGEHLYGPSDPSVPVLNYNDPVPIVDYPNAHNKGKPTWMTEYLVNDQTIGWAISTAKQIHDCLTIGNMSAYIWWKCLGDANGLVNASGVPQIRGFVMAQFSRFVRPNYYRIGVIDNTNTSISAYKDTNSPSFAIVAINTNLTTSVVQTFDLTNFNATTVTPWITSGSQSLAVQTPVTLTNDSFTYTLPPLSVVTFAGQAVANTAPTLNLTAISAGQVTLVVNGTQGPDYTLLTTTNLTAGWQVLYTSNSPAMPLTLVDTNSADAARFYRLQLGP